MTQLQYVKQYQKRILEFLIEKGNTLSPIEQTVWKDEYENVSDELRNFKNGAPEFSGIFNGVPVQPIVREAHLDTMKETEDGFLGPRVETEGPVVEDADLVQWVTDGGGRLWGDQF